MRIILEGPYKLYNFGDTAMMVSAYNRLNEVFIDPEIVIFTEEPDKVKKILPNAIALHVKKPDPRYRDVQIIPDILYKISPNSVKLKLEGLEFIILKKFSLGFIKLLKKVNLFLGVNSFKSLEISELYQEIKKSDMVLLTGGGTFNDSFFKHTKRIVSTLSLARELGKKTVICAQGIGPIVNKNLFNMVSNELRNTSLIGLREKKYSLELIKEMNVDLSKVIVTGDDAVEVAYNSRKAEVGENIGVNIRIIYYSKVSKNNLADISKVIIDKAENSQVNIISIPILTETRNSDTQSIRKLFSSYNLFKDEVLEYSEIDKLLNKFNDCRTVITGSYHAGVFALSKGIPVVAIAKSPYYVNKFNGLADMFGKGCFVVSLFERDYLKHFDKYFNEAWENVFTLRDALLERAAEQIEIQKEFYKELANLIGKNSKGTNYNQV